MILELDVGNSRIKWRWIDDSNSSGAVRTARDGHQLRKELELLDIEFRYCRLALVRSAAGLEHGLREVLKPWCKQGLVVAKVDRVSAGVTCGYEALEQLGVDRWLAVVAAYHKYQNACMVVDAGSALTVDYVTADGVHLGGMITPGFGMLFEQLKTGAGLPKVEQKGAEGPQQDTISCIDAGVSMMIQGFLHKAVQEGAALFGDKYTVVLTGGDAVQLLGWITGGKIEKELVLDGLKWLCPMK